MYYNHLNCFADFDQTSNTKAICADADRAGIWGRGVRYVEDTVYLAQTVGIADHHLLQKVNFPINHWRFS